jgi:hypothetical protein
MAGEDTLDRHRAEWLLVLGNPTRRHRTGIDEHAGVRVTLGAVAARGGDLGEAVTVGLKVLQEADRSLAKFVVRRK